MLKEAKFEELIGKTISEVSVNFGSKYDDCLVTIKTSDSLNTRDPFGVPLFKRHVYKMVHKQDCCEQVALEDFSIQEIKDLIHKKIKFAEVVKNEKEERFGISLWTFYKLTTEDGSFATLRFFGESNGYYSVDVDFYEEVPDEKTT